MILIIISVYASGIGLEKHITNKLQKHMDENHTRYTNTFNNCGQVYGEF